MLFLHVLQISFFLFLFPFSNTPSAATFPPTPSKQVTSTATGENGFLSAARARTSFFGFFFSSSCVSLLKRSPRCPLLLFPLSRNPKKIYAQAPRPNGFRLVSLSSFVSRSCARRFDFWGGAGSYFNGWPFFHVSFIFLFFLSLFLRFLLFFSLGFERLSLYFEGGKTPFFLLKTTCCFRTRNSRLSGPRIRRGREAVEMNENENLKSNQLLFDFYLKFG